ncbi:MAG: pyrroline-5-carboxylate reductase [Rhodospirillaceae bacterium]|nr:pyrroline-5-carboxylate reductase [Rhodospirillaceae bacterium]MBT5374631.1 pyrroline-5-carboxylate reductase [Rhodospirillaceae bacterium]MBT5660320.1 pyrroline-5-carboxylate reductase [Rhodospirillaceae bacterium]MBT5751978.1 pyrroline-5-carboxylate reductase [Rhodospirillaceae bacterium]
MGGVLLASWLDKGLSEKNVIIVDPAPPAAGAFSPGLSLKIVASADEIPPAFQPQIVFFAVKPQLMDEIVPRYSRFADTAGSPLFVSIAAGRTLASFESDLGAGTPLVRAMPNTPASVSRGVTVACANAAVSEDQRLACAALFEAVGFFDWVADEALIDAVTAVSGSGPAYVFYFTECLARAGVEAGLEPAMAMRLARSTVAGGGEMLHRTEDPPDVLRCNVTSPGGTTAAALDIFLENKALEALVERAVKAAKARAKKLSG